MPTTKKKIQSGRTGDTAALPESRRFGGSQEQDAAFDARPIMDCHVGGVKVRDLPVLSQRLIQFEQTDEGFAQRQIGKTGIGASVVRDQVDNTLRERDHDLKAGLPQDVAADPLRFLDKHKRPGFRLKLLSKRTGSVNPDYTLLKDENGDLLRYKNMLVGERPAEEVRADKRRSKKRSDDRLAALTDSFREQVKEGGFIPRTE